jgi:hypothetical protein
VQGGDHHLLHHARMPEADERFGGVHVGVHVGGGQADRQHHERKAVA